MLSDSPQGIEIVRHNNEMYALIVRASYSVAGIQFFTPSEYSQQLAFMKHPKGKIIDPHIHSPVSREVLYTKETLFLRRGKLRVDFYDKDRAYLESRILVAGDVILLAEGGHGFEVLEDLEMIEVKQGPYAGELDKIRFTATSSTDTGPTS